MGKKAKAECGNIAPQPAQFSLPMSGFADMTFMITDDPTAMSILRAIFDASSGCSGVMVRRTTLLRFTPIDPAAVEGAVKSLIEARLVAPGATDERLCLSRAGQMCARGMSPIGLPLQ